MQTWTGPAEQINKVYFKAGWPFNVKFYRFTIKGKLCFLLLYTI
jgi:hypothetical protein